MPNYTAIPVCPVDTFGHPLIAGGSGYPALPVSLTDGAGNIITAFTNIAQGGGSVTINANGQITASTPAGQSIILQPGSATDLVRIPQGSVQITNGFLGVLSAPSTANAVTIGSNTSLTGTSQRGVFATLTHDATGTTDAVIFQGIQTLTAGSTWARVGGVVMGAITQNSATITKFAAFGTDNQTVTVTNNFIGLDLNDQSGVHAANAYGFHLTNIAGGSSNTAGVHVQQVSGTGTNNYGVFVGAVAGATNNYAILTSGGTHSFTTSAGASGNISGQNFSIMLGQGAGTGSTGQQTGTATITGTNTPINYPFNLTMTFSGLTQAYDATSINGTYALGVKFVSDTGSQNMVQKTGAFQSNSSIQGSGTFGVVENNSNVVNTVASSTPTITDGYGVSGELIAFANGATITQFKGVLGLIQISSSSGGGTLIGGSFSVQNLGAGTVTSARSVYATAGNQTTAGTTTNSYASYLGSPTISGAGSTITTIYGEYTEPVFNTPNNSSTTGGFTAYGHYIHGPTQGGNTSGTNTMVTLLVELPTGADGGVGGTQNATGLNITGNGGSSGGGTTTIFALNSTSTAQSRFAGQMMFSGGTTTARTDSWATFDVTLPSSPTTYYVLDVFGRANVVATLQASIRATANFAAGGNTIAEYDLIRLDSPTFTSGTITTMRGHYIGNVGNAAVTTSTALYIAAQSGSGTNEAIHTLGGTVNIAAGGVVVGAATGGDKGNGTINVSSSIQLNGTAYTNPGWVFEKWLTGTVDKYAMEPGALEYDGPISLADTERIVRSTYDLPGFDPGHDLFRRAAFTLAKLEEAYIHLFDHERRLAALEAR